MKIATYGIGLALVLASPALAQDLKFSREYSVDCMAELEGDAQLTCIGASANACMADTPGGDTTVGMGGCLNAEWQYWDAELNDAYGELMTLYKASDAEAKAGGWTAPEQVAALKAMQRAWIGYRDARCDFERAKWGGGTGGGPATVQCMMEVTAAQTLLLRYGLDVLQ